MDETPQELPEGSQSCYKRSDAPWVMGEIRLHMEFCTRAWIGMGEGRVLILKDDVKGISTYYDYEEGAFTFHDGRGGRQIVQIEEITEICGY